MEVGTFRIRTRRAALCNEIGLVSIPSEVPRDTELLDLSNNQIEVFSLRRYTHLRVLLLASNEIRELPHHAFSDGTAVAQLELLDLTGNRLDVLRAGSLSGLSHLNTLLGVHATYLEPGAFQGLMKLKQLEITTEMVSLPENFLQVPLSSLRLVVPQATGLRHKLLHSMNLTLSTLYIRAPSLVRMHEDFLVHLLILRSVELELPNLGSLPVGIFNNYDQWCNRADGTARSPCEGEEDKEVHIRHIAIRGVKRWNPQIFSHLSPLEYLEITGAQGLPVGLLDGLQHLDYLDLSRNNIRNIDPEMFKSFRYPKLLNLSYNSLQQIEADDFKHIHSLDKLDLSHNNITHVESKSFSKIASHLLHLNLSHNAICNLPLNVFEGMFSLVELHHQHNCLDNLTSELFMDMGNLLYLHLQYNQISHLPEDMFEDLIDLLYVNLRGNRLHDPETFSMLIGDSIQKVDLSDNNLLCDCRMYTLVTLIQNSQSELKIHGVCSKPEHLANKTFVEALQYITPCPAPTTDQPLPTTDLVQATTETPMMTRPLVPTSTSRPPPAFTVVWTGIKPATEAVTKTTTLSRVSSMNPSSTEKHRTVNYRFTTARQQSTIYRANDRTEKITKNPPNGGRISSNEGDTKDDDNRTKKKILSTEWTDTTDILEPNQEEAQDPHHVLGQDTDYHLTTATYVLSALICIAALVVAGLSIRLARGHLYARSYTVNKV